SLNAPYQGGSFLTKPFIFTGNELELNYSTAAAGEIRIEIQDENGQPIPGFSMEESNAIIGNEIAGIARWNDNTDLSPLQSKPIRMYVYMKDADLYSIRFK